MSEQSMSRRAWTPREVASQLGIPYETVLDLIHKGSIKSLKAGRYYLVPDFARVADASVNVDQQFEALESSRE
jgi:excisionase family DNA binding protein